MERLRTDQRFVRRAGVSNELSQLRGRHKLVGQLCELSDGPCIYIRPAMQSSAIGRGITEKDWKATRKHMARTLSELRVAPKESEEVIALWTRYKDEIAEPFAAH